MRRVLALSLLFSFLPLLVSAASCFDYYKFQSVELDLHGEKQVYKAGEGAKKSRLRLRSHVLDDLGRGK